MSEDAAIITDAKQKRTTTAICQRRNRLRDIGGIRLSGPELDPLTFAADISSSFSGFFVTDRRRPSSTAFQWTIRPVPADQVVAAGPTLGGNPARPRFLVRCKNLPHLRHRVEHALLELLGEWDVLADSVCQDDDSVGRPHLVDLLNEEAEGTDLKHVRREKPACTRLLFHWYVGIANPHQLIASSGETETVRAQRWREEEGVFGRDDRSVLDPEPRTLSAAPAAEQDERRHRDREEDEQKNDAHPPPRSSARPTRTTRPRMAINKTQRARSAVRMRSACRPIFRWAIRPLSRCFSASGLMGTRRRWRYHACGQNAKEPSSDAVIQTELDALPSDPME